MAPLDYERCTIPELQKFIHVRTGVTPRPRQKKITYLRTVRELDNSLEFQFLDLPAEMRHMIYHDILSTKNNGRSPAILRTCRQVHVEAEPVLYDSEVFSIRLTYSEYRRLNGWGAAPTTVHLLSVMRGNGRTWYESSDTTSKTVFETFLQWPDYLRKARHLRLALTAYEALEPEHLEELHHLLYSLTSHLSSNTIIKSLEVSLHGLPLVHLAGREQAKRILRPIRNISVSEGTIIRLNTWEPLGDGRLVERPEIIDSEILGIGGLLLRSELHDSLHRYGKVARKIKAVKDALDAMDRQVEEAEALRTLFTKMQKWNAFAGFVDAGLDAELKNDVSVMEDLLERAISFH